jgi:hypothetical protein
MLQIKEGDEVALVERYHLAHNISTMLYDQMANILVNDSYKPFRGPKFDVLDTHIHAKEFRNNAIGALDWLAANKMDAMFTHVVLSDVVSSLLVDFLDFVYVSLDTAKEGRMSVAYALLRKPMSDLLLLFEQILVDKQDFIDRYEHQGDPLAYDPSVASLDKKGIITRAVAKLQLTDMYSADFLYQARHDKSFAYGITGITHQALHIVTRDKHYKTADKTLNVIFADAQYVEPFWKHYYHIVPYLLLYASSVLDEIVFEFLPGQERRKHLNNIKRFILFTQLAASRNEPPVIIDGQEFYEYMQDGLTHTCKSCQYQVSSVTEDDYLFFAETEQILCNQCHNDLFADADFANQFHAVWDGILPQAGGGMVN